MKTFAISTLGCKVNQYESQQIRELLERLGLRQADSRNKSDIVIVNTCCVTHTASAKSRQCVRKAQKLSPDALIVVCGCLPTGQIGELNGASENVHLIGHKDDLAPVLSQIVNGRASVVSICQRAQTAQSNIIRAENADEIKYKTGFTGLPKLPQLTRFKGQTRAFLKIQDGCDGCCSYCIIPKTRPHVHSKPPEAALQEARALVEAGHKEIVVTGIFLGAYGQSSVRRRNWDRRRNDRLADLLDKMAAIPNLLRIRVSSLGPTDVTPRLVDVFCSHPNIMPHLHLSLQSGSDAVLRRMCRRYTVSEFSRTVEAIKARLDRPAITTDIIAGFPGETDDDFQQTIALARETGFAKIHVFSFSPREGTAAARMQDTVDNRVMKERSRILRDLDTKLGGKFREQFVGETAVVLVENSNGRPYGRSERYFMVYLERTGLSCRKNELVRAKLIESKENGAVGRVVTQQRASEMMSNETRKGKISCNEIRRAAS
ncbi:MAG TPA: tRNA (N(6)-L-threonylcarbamoyladenosine(37)-C(2))-methylthiotransferase MtaB [Sedimentisphaerales bacterium]|nr:tRNA (N(6)-L-threonylcarbamoyladenosine(37)-C(2))-methylthiotransferase MtaB [Sedimentisphaerales bacterium]